MTRRPHTRNANAAPHELLKDFPEPFRVFTAEHTILAHDIYLSDELIEPSAYDELCHLLRNAAPEDDIRLYINTPGGSVSSGLAIIQAMQESEASITTILNPEAYSMGALMFVAGDSHVINDKSILMFHNYSGGLFGKGNEQAAEIAAVKPWFEKIMNDICCPFLTEEEVTAVLRGSDLWLRQEEILPRLERLHAHRNAQPAQS